MNIQKLMKGLWDEACLALCYAYWVLRDSNPKVLVPYVVEGWSKGYIRDDGYVEKPVEYLNMHPGKNVADIRKAPYRKEDVYNPTIVRYSNGTYSHFVVEDGYGILFDPMGGESHTVKMGKGADIRQVLTN